MNCARPTEAREGSQAARFTPPQRIEGGFLIHIPIKFVGELAHHCEGYGQRLRTKIAAGLLEHFRDP